MNYSMMLKFMGSVLKYEGIFMALPLAVAIIYGGDDVIPMTASMAVTFATGLLLSMIKNKDKTMRAKDGFAAAGLSWILLSLFGALPFFISGKFGGFANCFFEAASGFTTSGATILVAVEAIPKGLLFWRNFMNFIGGIGIIVFVLAVIPSISPSTVQLFKAESPGPMPHKIVPKIKDTAKYTCAIYLALTVLTVVLLMIAGLPLYDAVATAFSTAGTGGFAVRNASIAAYNSAAVEVIITVFLVLFGANFSLFFLLMRRDFKSVFKDEELRLYLFIVIAAIVAIGISLLSVYGNIMDSLRYSSFQVASFMSTAGFYSADYDMWPSFAKGVLLVMSVIGGSAGSSAGGIKVVRVLVFFKAVKVEVMRLVHPNMVSSIKINKKSAETGAVYKIFLFLLIYVAFAMFSVLALSIQGTDLPSCVSAVVAMLSNVGVSVGMVSPTSNYSAFSDGSKVLLSFCMLAGRLEFMPFLLLLSPSTWKKRTII